MTELIEVLSNYIPELMTMTIGGISIGTVIYLVTFIFKKLESFRKDPNVEALKQENKQLIEANARLHEDNEKLLKRLDVIEDDIHHIYHEED